MRFLLAGLSVSLLVAGMAMGQEGAPKKSEMVWTATILGVGG